MINATVFQGRGRRLLAWVPVVTCMVFLLLGNSRVIAASCPNGTERDYAEPLEKLPPIHKAPVSGQLPFGPKAARLEGPPLLLAGGGKVGFRLISLKYGRMHLGWRLHFEATRITPKGPRWIPEKIETRWVASVDGSSANGVAEFTASLPVQPASYRLKLTIRDRAHTRLGSYGAYVRVVPKAFNARLLLGADQVSSGGSISTRIENIGTTGLVYGQALNLERWDGTAWTEIQGGQATGGEGIFLGAGQLSFCQSLTLPQMDSGLYRAVKPIVVNGKRRSLSAQFQVG